LLAQAATPSVDAINNAVAVNRGAWLVMCAPELQERAHISAIPARHNLVETGPHGPAGAGSAGAWRGAPATGARPPRFGCAAGPGERFRPAPVALFGSASRRPRSDHVGLFRRIVGKARGKARGCRSLGT
jgi:hypothetical protein